MDVIKVDAEIEIALKNKLLDPMCAVKAEQIACKFVAERVVSWSLKAVGIHEIAVSAASCERLHPYLFGALYRIIRGTQVSDKKPDEETKPTDEEQVKN
jgi:hypothetical protein